MAYTSVSPLPKFSTIGTAEKSNLSKAMRKPLSGYLGGEVRGGYWVERLSDEWCGTFDCKYAIPCNSATSGLLAACMAVPIRQGDLVWITAYSMSATAACARVLGARIVFIDIETIRYSMNMNLFRGTIPKCIIATNLFGHPAYIGAMRSWCDSNNVILIEDNAQAPFAMENGRYAGTVGHMGVFSLNVHKHMQSGEGGVICTDEFELSNKIHAAINHGELAGHSAGLNLRMTEPIAAIASAQLAKGLRIVGTRREIAHQLTDMVKDVSWIVPPAEDVGCYHVYYMWAARILDGKRQRFGFELHTRNVPIRTGYSKPLNRIFMTESNEIAAWHAKCSVAEKIDDEEIITFEVCAYDPKTRHLRQMREAIKEAAEECE